MRRVERRVSTQRRRGLDNRLAERDGSSNRRGRDRRVGVSQEAAPMRIRVLVIEDNRLMRDGLSHLLAAFGDVEVVAAVEGANAGMEQVRDTKPHVVLVDAALANGDSHTFLAGLKTIAPNAKAIVMDFVPAQHDVSRFIEGGANGFIMKDATADDFVKAIRSVADGKDLMAAELGNKEIAQRLNIATNTVKSHVHNMLGKLSTLTPPDRRSRTRSRRGASRRSSRFLR